MAAVDTCKIKLPNSCQDAQRAMAPGLAGLYSVHSAHSVHHSVYTRPALSWDTSHTLSSTRRADQHLSADLSQSGHVETAPLPASRCLEIAVASEHPPRVRD